MLAIDFGTTRTKVAYYDPSKGRVSLANLGSGDSIAFPSLFYIGTDGQVFCGSDALDFLDSDPGGTVRRVKSRLRDRAIRVNGQTIRPLDLVTKLFASLRARAADEIPAFAGKPPTSVVLTLPAAGAGSGPVVEKIMRAAAFAAGFTEVDLLTEPEGAAMAWQHEEGAGQDDVVVILDGGGGTVDWACLKRVDGTLRLFPDCPPGGDDKVGGEYLDEDLFGILVAKLEAREAGQALDTVQSQSNKWFSRIRGLRERFNRTGKVSTQDAMRVLGEVVSLDDDEVRGAIQDRFINQVCAGFGRYLDTVRRATGAKNPRVLLVGGTGQISGLKEALRDRCNCEPTWWQLSEFAPVIGATWWGTERAGLLAARHVSPVAATAVEQGGRVEWQATETARREKAIAAKAAAEQAAKADYGASVVKAKAEMAAAEMAAADKAAADKAAAEKAAADKAVADKAAAAKPEPEAEGPAAAPVEQALVASAALAPVAKTAEKGTASTVRRPPPMVNQVGASPAPAVPPPSTPAPQGSGGVSLLRIGAGVVILGFVGMGVLGIGAMAVAALNSGSSGASSDTVIGAAAQVVAGEDPELARMRAAEQERLAREQAERRAEAARQEALAAERARKQAECDAVRSDVSAYLPADLGTSILGCMHPSATVVAAEATGEVDACSDGQNNSGGINYTIVWDGFMNRYTTQIRVDWKMVNGLTSGRTVLVSDNATVGAEPGCIRGGWVVMEGE